MGGWAGGSVVVVGVQVRVGVQLGWIRFDWDGVMVGLD